METDLKILTTYDNKQVELIFNENFICPKREGIVDLNLGIRALNWKIRMVFDNNEGKVPLETNWEYGIDGFDIKITFHKWFSTSAIEFKQPQVITTRDKRSTFYFQMRTQATLTSENNRVIHLSIWKAI